MKYQRLRLLHVFLECCISSTSQKFFRLFFCKLRLSFLAGNTFDLTLIENRLLRLSLIHIYGVCERCKTPVTKKNLSQWYFKITDYADRLLENLVYNLFVGQYSLKARTPVDRIFFLEMCIRDRPYQDCWQHFTYLLICR